MDVHLKNAAAIIFLILTNFPWFVSPLYAQNIKFNDGMEVRLPAYKNRRSNPDGSDSVCVDVHWLKIMATICLCSKTSEKLLKRMDLLDMGIFLRRAEVGFRQFLMMLLCIWKGV